MSTLPEDRRTRASLHSWGARLAPGFLWLAIACSGQDPDEKTLEASHSSNASESCKDCHPRHVEEWRISSHAYALKDPVFTAMVKLGQNETRGELGDFCVKCHSPMGNRRGEFTVRHDAKTGEYAQIPEELSLAAQEGVSCVTCHSTTKVNVAANADFELSEDGIRRATIQNPDETPAHGSKFSDLHSRSVFCGSCHVVVNPKGVRLEETHVEWVQSIFNGTKDCQTCHMPEYRGPAATGHRERTVHAHVMPGVDVSLVADEDFPGYDELRARTEELLAGTAVLELSVDAGSKRLDVSITNNAGHALPSGATGDREMWIEMLVTDGTGATVFESGTLDARGDLRVSNAERTLSPGTDPALVLYTQEMTFDPKLDDPTSTEPPRVVDFLWEPNQEKSRLIAPAAVSRSSYDLSSLPPGPYMGRARLLFRSFPPHLLRKLETLAGLDPDVGKRVPIVEMQAQDVAFTL